MSYTACDCVRDLLSNGEKRTKEQLWTECAGLSGGEDEQEFYQLLDSMVEDDANDRKHDMGGRYLEHVTRHSITWYYLTD